MFDSNAMLELQHIARDRYQRNGGGGGGKAYTSSRAYYDARGYTEMSPWRRLVLDTTVRWKQSCDIAKAHFATDCMVDREGFYHGESIPF